MSDPLGQTQGESLTPRQQAVLEAIRAYVAEGYGPGPAEIARRVGLSVTTVKTHLDVLAAKGFIEIEDRAVGHGYALRLVRP